MATVNYAPDIGSDMYYSKFPATTTRGRHLVIFIVRFLPTLKGWLTYFTSHKSKEMRGMQ